MEASAAFNTSFKYSDFDFNKIYKYLIRNADAIARMINQYLAKVQYNKALEICKPAVDRFYGDYTPLAYKRVYSFYNVYDFGITDGGEGFKFQLGPELMTGWHHQGNEFVYNLGFEMGSHGGPVWRTPIPEFTYPMAVDVPITYPSPAYLIFSQWGAFIDGEYPALKAEAIRNAIGSIIASM